MSDPCTVLIAAASALPALKERALEWYDEVLAFADVSTLLALDTITARRPRLVVLEQLFAASPRGTALINRLTSDPGLAGTEIRILAAEGDVVRVVERQGATLPAETVMPSPSVGDDGPSLAVVDGASVPSAAVTAIDQRGTRRAPRFEMAGQVEALLDGNTVLLVDLSTCGAQVVSASILKPNQRVRLVLTDAAGIVRLNATVAWASFEIHPTGGPRYRAGLDFFGADPAPVDAYCARHRV